MPLIRFENKKQEGAYLLLTSVPVGCFPARVYGVTDFNLRLLEPLFREKRIRYHRLTQQEADQLIRDFERKRSKAAKPNHKRNAQKKRRAL